LLDDLLGVVPDRACIIGAISQVTRDLPNGRVLNLSQETEGDVSPLESLTPNIITVLCLVLEYNWCVFGSMILNSL
jgi:hypothetical protein